MFKKIVVNPEEYGSTDFATATKCGRRPASLVNLQAH